MQHGTCLFPHLDMPEACLGSTGSFFSSHDLKCKIGRGLKLWESTTPGNVQVCVQWCKISLPDEGFLLHAADLQLQVCGVGVGNIAMAEKVVGQIHLTKASSHMFLPTVRWW